MNINIVLTLIRLPNLIIIGLTQYFCRFFLLNPILKLNNLNSFFSEVEFALLFISTATIAAGGYLINDYFDTDNDLANAKFNKTEYINKNKKAILWTYKILSSTGILIGGYLGYKIGNTLLIFAFILVVILLWFYSTSYKKQGLIGNIIIAFLSSFSIAIVWIFVFYAINNSSVQIRFNILYLQMILGYILFSFTISLAREFIKDIEDIEGDKIVNLKTVPIVIGIPKTKILTLAIIGISIFFLIKTEIWMFQLKIISLFYYFTFLINLLFIFLLIWLLKSNTKKEYRETQQLAKILILAGIISMVFIPAYADKFI